MIGPAFGRPAAASSYVGCFDSDGLHVTAIPVTRELPSGRLSLSVVLSLGAWIP